jgi:hypothetical protein
MSSEPTISPEMLSEEQRDNLLIVQKWNFIDVSKIKTQKSQNIGHRLNALASLYYFTKVVLRKHRLTQALHKPICDIFEAFHLKEALEIPRDHFKSTIASEAAPMWWALPFNDTDEKYMRDLGYGDDWVRWMRRAHNPDTRTLLVSENITNAKKLGHKISLHYENNSLFRGLFPEILPNEKCKWTEESMCHTRTKDATAQGEGTYDFLGVGGALQSRHYDRLIQDDLVGRKAIDSEAIMESTIQYHQLLVGAFDSSHTNAVVDNDELIIGNRWSDKDLGFWVREHEPYFRFHNHSALGGCCPSHPIGHTIFPEEFSVEKLLRWKSRLGTYLFSCQFLNDPMASGSARFKEEWLNYFSLEIADSRPSGTREDGTILFTDPRIKIRHEVKNGQVIKEIFPRELSSISMVVDPNHSEDKGRCRHAITVTGVFSKPQRVYLLDCWAEACSFDKLINKIKEFVSKWKLREIWLETIAAQRYLKFHLDTLNRLGLEGVRFKVRELKVDRGDAAKARRIESFDPIYENGQFFCQRKHLDFIEEYRKYPHGKTLDILDTIGYAPQTWGVQTSIDEVKDFIARHKNAHLQGRASQGNVSITGY